MLRAQQVLLLLLFINITFMGCSGNEAFKHTKRGDQYYSESKYDLAAAEYTKAIALKLDSHYLYMMRCESYYYIKRYELAIADCSKAIELKAELATPYIQRGRSYAALGKYDPAIEDIQKAMKLNPSLTDTFERLLSQIRSMKAEEEVEKEKGNQQKITKPVNVF